MTQETSTPPHHRSDAQPTILAGRYELGAVLGRGGMATVFAGRDVVLDRDVAVKVFPIDASQPSSAGRFEQEARLLAGLAHPGLVTVFDAGIDATVADGARPFLVMELVTGPTLGERIAAAPLTSGQTAALAAELAGALAHIHRRDIVHRDVKPANVLLATPDDPSEATRAKLTDFGIARLVDGTRMTLTGYTIGTANYLSPEQLTGGPVTPATDIYALGLVLLECLTGVAAYPGAGAEAALVRLHKAPEIPQSVPPDWARLLRTMTASDPLDRPAATEVAVAVPGLGGEAPPAVASAMPTGAPAAAETVALPAAPASWEPQPTAAHGPSATRVLPMPAHPDRAARPRRSWRPPWLWIAAAAVVVGLLIAVVVAAGSTSGPAPKAPAYPSVPGKLGTDLRRLQQDVSP